jgi:hypothetical protein
MNVAGRYYRLIEPFTKLYNPPVYVFNILCRIYISNLFRSDHKLIVSRRLNLQIIIKIHQLRDLLFGFLIQKRPV